MTRARAIELATAYFDEGRFTADLARRVAIPTESQNPDRAAALHDYLEREIRPCLEDLGYACRMEANPVAGMGPFLLAERHEGDELPTVLTYGHGDVIRGQDESWRPGLSPWELRQEGERMYGRGTADNKGQHSINLAALACVIAARGRLGFNSRILIETGEETGSPGLHEIARRHGERLRADILVGSDGPRVRRDCPTIVMGTRGALNFDLAIELREGGHHSGNWGGLLANPGVILANAIASIIDAKGQVKIAELKPGGGIPNSVRNALARVRLESGEGAPEVNEWWGEAGLTPVERVFAWNTFEVLAFKTGNPDRPVNAIPPSARAHCQIRFVKGSDEKDFLPAIRRHLDRHGFQAVQVSAARDVYFPATRLDPEHPWALWCRDSIRRTTGTEPDVVPNLGGSLPNDVFTDLLGMPTLWIPHSYGACSQHAPNEHLLAPLAREGLAIMAGIFWDLGEPGLPARSDAAV
ncbi:MAG: M20 family metallopeptidase [Alphaproteobacteria bacterium]|nr:M20 family metallopeptidase [Alphaproteobacteria bacterium]